MRCPSNYFTRRLRVALSTSPLCNAVRVMTPPCKFSYKFMWNYGFKLGHVFLITFFLRFSWSVEQWKEEAMTQTHCFDATFKPNRQIWDVAWEDGRARWLGEMLTLGKYYCWCHWVVLSALQAVQKRIPSRGGRKIIWQSLCFLFLFCYFGHVMVRSAAVYLLQRQRRIWHV